MRVLMLESCTCDVAYMDALRERALRTYNREVVELMPLSTDFSSDPPTFEALGVPGTDVLTRAAVACRGCLSNFIADGKLWLGLSGAYLGVVDATGEVGDGFTELQSYLDFLVAQLGFTAATTVVWIDDETNGTPKHGVLSDRLSDAGYSTICWAIRKPQAWPLERTFDQAGVRQSTSDLAFSDVDMYAAPGDWNNAKWGTGDTTRRSNYQRAVLTNVANGLRGGLMSIGVHETSVGDAWSFGIRTRVIHAALASGAQVVRYFSGTPAPTEPGAFVRANDAFNTALTFSDRWSLNTSPSAASDVFAVICDPMTLICLLAARIDEGTRPQVVATDRPVNAFGGATPTYEETGALLSSFDEIDVTQLADGFPRGAPKYPGTSSFIWFGLNMSTGA